MDVDYINREHGEHGGDSGKTLANSPGGGWDTLLSREGNVHASRGCV